MIRDDRFRCERLGMKLHMLPRRAGREFLRISAGVLVLWLLPGLAFAQPGTIQTVAGNGRFASSPDGGRASEISLQHPFGVAVGPDGALLVAETAGHRIRRIDAVTGLISTVVGNGQAAYSGDGGLARNASINNPYSIALDEAGNLYIADAFNHRVRHVKVLPQDRQRKRWSGWRGPFSPAGADESRPLRFVWLPQCGQRTRRF